jgi:hypothetical protein
MGDDSPPTFPVSPIFFFYFAHKDDNFASENRDIEKYERAKEISFDDGRDDAGERRHDGTE